MSKAMDIEKCYNEHKYLIQEIVSKFYKQFGGDYDELMADANLIFSTYFYKYDENKAKFSTYLYFNLWTDLLSIRRKELKNKIVSLEDIADTIISVNPTYSIDLIDCFKGDCKYIIDLIMSSDKLSEIYAKYKTAHRNRNLKNVLSRYLSNELHWDSRRIKYTFERIKQILNYKSR